MLLGARLRVVRDERVVVHDEVRGRHSPGGETGSAVRDGLERLPGPQPTALEALASLGPLATRFALSPDRLAALLQVAVAGFELRLFAEDPKKLRRTFEDFKALVRAALTPRPAGREPGSKGGGAA